MAARKSRKESQPVESWPLLVLRQTMVVVVDDDDDDDDVVVGTARNNVDGWTKPCVDGAKSAINESNRNSIF